MVEPYDEPRLLATDLVIRRVDPENHVVPDENAGGYRISSKLYEPSSSGSRGMSIDVHKLIVEAGIDPRQFVTTPKFRGSVSFRVEAARDTGLVVGYEAIPENAYHGEVWRCGDKRDFTRRQKKDLQAAAEWFVELPGVSLRA